jgi:hypothetical protein
MALSQRPRWLLLWEDDCHVCSGTFDALEAIAMPASVRH